MKNKVVAAEFEGRRYCDWTMFPWDRIESINGRSLSEEMRKDIFDVYVRVENERAQLAAAVPLSELTKLKSQIAEPSKAVWELYWGADSDDAMELKIAALSRYQGADIKELLHAAGKACSKLLEALNQEQAGSASLRDFRNVRAPILRYAVALTRAELLDEPGRKRADWWGFPPGRRSPKYRALLSVLVGDKVGEDDVKNAFSALRRNSAGTGTRYDG